MKRMLVVSTAVLCAALLVVGCGSSKKKETTAASPPPTTTTPATAPASKQPSGQGQTLKLSADPSAIKFDKSSLTAKAGQVTLVMDNPSPIPHAVAVEGNGVDKDGNTVMKGGVSKVTVSLKPGKYEFYCPVDGHKQQGMKGDLTVQ